MAKKRKGGKFKGRTPIRNSHLLEGKKTEIITENGAPKFGDSIKKEQVEGKTMKALTETKTNQVIAEKDNRADKPMSKNTERIPNQGTNIQTKIQQIIAAKNESPEKEGQKFQDRIKGEKGLESKIKQIISEKETSSGKAGEQKNLEKRNHSDKSTLGTSKNPQQQEQKPQEPQSKNQPTALQKDAQKAQGKHASKGLMAKIVEEVKNVDVKQAVKVASPLVSRFAGKYGAVVMAAGSVAMELIEDSKKNKQEQKPIAKGVGNEKTIRLQSTTSLTTPAMADRQKVQENIKGQQKGKGETNKIDSLKQGQNQEAKKSTPTKKPPTRGR